MSKKQQPRTPTTRVKPGEEKPPTDESLESVAGGCQIGCSNANTCIDFMSADHMPEPVILQ